VPLVVRAFRSLDLPGAIREHVHIKQRGRGYDKATFVESLVVLNAVGGECVEDLKRLGKWMEAWRLLPLADLKEGLISG
jgi:hypothetical protein